MIQNLHSHTTFCDGKNTPEEMVRAAIALGMDSLGFSGHMPAGWRSFWESSGTGSGLPTGGTGTM